MFWNGEAIDLRSLAATLERTQQLAVVPELHLQPDALAPYARVDEVLAVGDKAFREKCYTRMENLLSEGRTLFLVSHSEKDLKRFGTRGLYLSQGELVMDGPMEEVLERYNEDQGTARS